MPMRLIIMDVLYRKWHSEESDGYCDGSGERRAVFHICLNCQYLKTISRNGNQKRGKGKDENGKPRIRCSRCTALLRRNKCPKCSPRFMLRR